MVAVIMNKKAWCILKYFKKISFFKKFNSIISSLFVLRSIPIANYNMNVQDACKKQLKNPSLIVFATAKLMKVNRIRFLIYITISTFTSVHPYGSVGVGVSGVTLPIPAVVPQELRDIY